MVLTVFTRNRRIEAFVYCALWVIVAGIYLLDRMRNRAGAGLPVIDLKMILGMIINLSPFFALFIVNNAVLIPRLLLRNRYVTYCIAAATGVVILWAWQSYQFTFSPGRFPEGLPPEPPFHNHIRPLLPLPLLLDFAYALLVIGGNIAVALVFRRLDDRLERESLMKAHAESELAGLKAQINPHFYMNMLNNIHGMIEIDPSRAQEMVLGLSGLMRHLLYEASHPMVSLESEVSFLNHYLALMKQRYPGDKVSITADFPPPAEMQGIRVPSLLMLVFVENAFKHGVSYAADSFVAVRLTVEDSYVRFACINSRHSPARSDSERPGGIGLRNAAQRLQLIYGSRATLDIAQTPGTYNVNLLIPVNDTPNTDS